MKKSLFEQMGGTYTQQGDYVLPNLILLAENQPIGIWTVARTVFETAPQNSVL